MNSNFDYVINAKQHSWTGTQLLYSYCAICFAYELTLNYTTKCNCAKYVHQPSAAVGTCMGASVVQHDDMLRQHIQERTCTCAVLM